jgi:hypothetical protein
MSLFSLFLQWLFSFEKLEKILEHCTYEQYNMRLYSMRRRFHPVISLLQGGSA